MKINVSKMHGTGNSFIVFDNRKENIQNLSEIARKVCDHRFGIGADGMITVEESNSFDFRMRIFNADGSEPEMCGNGIRCFAWFLNYHQISTKKNHDVETLSGKIETSLVEVNEHNCLVKVNMGNPTFSNKDFIHPQNTKVTIEERDFVFVSMGNPHAITFVENHQFDYHTLGEKIENHVAIFPNKTNVEFVKIINEKEIEMRVWERGCGETFACGTGACASVVASFETGNLSKTKRDEEITVHLLGGDLKILWSPSSNKVFMTGPAVNVLDGTLFL